MVNSTIALGLTVATLIAFTGVDVRLSRGRVDSVEDFISARNPAGSRRTTTTLVASVMGVWVLFSAPEAGASFGIAAVVGYTIGETVPMPVYARLGPWVRELIPEGHSLTEYARTRYGTTVYTFVLLVNTLYISIFLATELTGIAGTLSPVTGTPQWQTTLLVGGFVPFYTGYGGLRTNITTNAVRTVVVIPLLLLAFAGMLVALGGPAAAIDGITMTSPAFLDLGAVAGPRFGLALAFAILGTELINQTWWQRIYAVGLSKTVGRSFRTAALANGAVVFVTTFFGVVVVDNAAVVTDPASVSYNAGAAFFVLLGKAFPEWLVLAAILLAFLLVINSIDTLFNMLSSLVTADLTHLLTEPSDRHLAPGSRALAAVVAAVTIYISLRAQSAPRLFLFADLLSATVAFPLVYGLYSTRITGLGAPASSLIGLAVGLAFFPDLRGAIASTPIAGNLFPAADPLYLTSFGGTFVVPAAASLVAARLADARFDLGQLSREIRQFDDNQTDAPSSD